MKHNAISMKHLSMLRRAIMQQESGDLRFVSLKGFSGTISLHKGEITSTTRKQDVVSFFAEGMQLCRWMNRSELSQSPTNNATHLLLQGLEKSHYCMNTMQSIRELFNKLPRIEMRLSHIQFADYRDEICYHLLHRQINQQGYTPAMFLEKVENEETLRQRIKILILVYCLGLIVPNKLPKSAPVQALNGGTIVHRIFRRLQAI